ncbi:MAG TPA: T9SS type B sorting domain-containing protein [Chitinophagaceae bacterium]|nr:T9SS type B sorting domain-containing protein [Chitinophagaceae bacterium]
MFKKILKRLPFYLIICITSPVFSQIQSCPANINFSSGDLSFWSAQTGLVNGATQNYPAPNNGISSIPEYGISTTGVRVITSSYNDLYGGFPTVPTINGYSYNYSVLIGSNSTSWDLHSTITNPGGFTRSVTYIINVPAGPASVPYTMTYAYAMVLENGTHNSNQQPLFKATLSTADSVITCASPQYYLPTFNNAGGGSGGTGATLDTVAALANGFTLSPVLFLTHTGVNNTTGTWLQDVWTKGWTEVTFDLSAYRGQQVTLSFESDNCAPGGHFAYAYFAIRNTCAGLQISGNNVACSGSTATYSVPSLANATYQWTVPPGWTINSGANSNVINVTAGASGGIITIHEVNNCADLRDTITVSTSPPTVPGQLNSNNRVCTGNNNTLLTLSGQTGNILNWISSTNGVTWTPVANTTNSYSAQNLVQTTQYAVVVQNGLACKVDTSSIAIITVDPKSVGGSIVPSNINVCLNENTNNLLSLTGNTGAVFNWQSSPDNISWNSFVPVNTNSTYTVNSVNATTYYRIIVKSGVCPTDTSLSATITFINVAYPDANINPPSASICYGKTTPLNATINIGTSYAWSNSSTLTNQGNGTITTLPFVINATAAPKRSTDYVLTVNNAGCPNPLRDTFHLIVAPKIYVFAGNDTAIVAGQPLQLNAKVNDSTANVWNWRPSFGLNNPDIYYPIANLGQETEIITYIVRATNADGCYGEDNIKVTVFKTGPDIFMPTAFTPNSDGLNDIISPICVGIRQLNFFRIFNRWGQLVFSTSEIGKGWDGRIGGILQDANTFAFMVQGVDYTGKTVFKKGTTTLIR